MKKSIVHIGLLALLIGAIGFIPSPALGQAAKAESNQKASPEKAQKSAKNPRALPFRGKVTAINKTAKTVTVGERVFHLTADTRILKGGNKATLEDAVVGEEVGGSYRKADDGKLMVQMIRFGPKPDTQGAKKGRAKKEAQPKKVD